MPGANRHRLWKANARGIDINRNYAEGFDRGGAKTPGHKQYAGKTPISEMPVKHLYLNRKPRHRYR